MKDLLTKFAEGGKAATGGDGYVRYSANPDADTYIKNEGSKDLGNTVIGIINAVIGILGLVCVVVIIIGGYNYMTSSGDSAKVKKAKDTILYGLIGLVVCVLAYAIVNFILNKVLLGG